MKNIFSGRNKAIEDLPSSAGANEYDLPVAGPNARIATLGHVAGQVTIIGDPHETQALFMQLAQEKITRGKGE